MSQHRHRCLHGIVPSFDQQRLTLRHDVVSRLNGYVVSWNFSGDFCFADDAGCDDF